MLKILEVNECFNCRKEKVIFYKRGQLCEYCNNIRKFDAKRFRRVNGGNLPKVKVKPHNKLKKVSSKKKETVGKLTKKLDRIFSQFIRLRDTDENGYGYCVTCENNIKYKEAHCGHFIVRGRKKTRWDERNCNLQCPGCNTYRCGEQYLHGQEIHNKHGHRAPDLLYRISRQDFKPGLPWLREQIDIYKNKVKELLKDKNFTI